jgi:hypothetical protein
MPTLPASLPIVPAGGDQPVNSADDVRSILPPEARTLPAEQAPVREALVELVTSTHLAWQNSSAYAAAQSDVSRATNLYLDGLLGDRGIPRQPNESDETYRDRGLTSPELVSPAVILSAVNAILAPYTDVKACLFPCILDQLFVHDGTASWHAFLWNSDPQDPDYADRRYDDRSAATPNVNPGNTWLFTSGLLGRGFVLRVPLLSNLSPEGAYINDGTVQPDDGYVGDGSNDSGSEADGSIGLFIYLTETDALSIYQQIVGAVEALRGHGVRWELFVDPDLN